MTRRTFCDCCTAPFGINFDAAFPITPAIDVVGQLDWSRWSDSEVIFGTSVDVAADFTTFGGGIRWSARGNPSATPFLHALIGAVHTSLGCEVGGIDCEEFIGEDTSSNDLDVPDWRRRRGACWRHWRGRTVRLSPLFL